ncbi:hypothetical protein [Mycobacterium sp. URHB0044]|jgi:hypothetical protein|uniref:hypothetical protein n=1 Tax=Mycobacterium sp. URHB0044 TaxID=1380386 RepID=UPI00048BCE8E|nr:hypothetical protein [Mycobacterium sp. URHB0044]
MSVSTLDASDAAPLCLDGSIEWSDPDTECTLVVSEPKSEPTLWAEYVRGAQDSYRKHGVERALDQASLRHPSETSLFLGAVDQSGRMVAGVRAKGPYLDADESHATIEWAGQPGLPTVRKLIADRIPFGVVEIKTAWVGDDPDRNRSLTNALARFPLHSTMLLDAKFALATSGDHVLARWRSSGGVVASQVPATPYPDERYQTKMMWWDRSTFSQHAVPRQISRIAAEFRLLARHLDRSGESVPVAGGQQ